MTTVEERFWGRVDKAAPGGCWLWTGSLNRDGYGQVFVVDSRGVHRGVRPVRMAPHRFSYTLENGEIAEGKQLDHLCRTRNCVNPAHLEQVTSRENTLRGLGIASSNAAKTTCPSGHSLCGDNLYLSPAGKRGCRVCRNEATRRFALKRSTETRKELR